MTHEHPEEHIELYEEKANKGCILSGIHRKGPRRIFFPKRNRLIAALSYELYAIDTGICDAEKKLDFKARLEYL